MLLNRILSVTSPLMYKNQHLLRPVRGLELCLQPNEKRDYEAALKALDLAQSNRKNISATVQNKQIPHNEFSTTLVQVEKYLIRSELSLKTLDGLQVIHVAGTKGKGSTCALCESILRQHGLKTGFFSSPHILDVCERIRINGTPISHEDFARYFWQVYSKLDRHKENDEDMPHYFRLLTIIAFKVFLEEKVDVAIIEVGIGGQYDCTNILRNVPVAGITSLGLDHTELLGNTIREIAWQKAGIMKEKSHVFTVPQDENAMTVLQQRSAERKCNLQVVEPKLNIKLSKEIQAPLEVFNLNASLAIALAQCWMSLTGRELDNEATIIGIERCFWPGRYQIIRHNNFVFYVDGAHTPESIDLCSEWFIAKTRNSKNKKILVYNITGNRKSEILLKTFLNIEFTSVFFTPNRAFPEAEDNVLDNEMIKCQMNNKIWTDLKGSGDSCVCSSVNEVFNHLSTSDPYDILVTGSLYLVSAVLSIVDPNMKTPKV